MFSKSQEKNLLPCKMGMKNFDKEEINIPDMRYGNEYMEVLAHGIRTIKDIPRCNLSRNRLTRSLDK